MRFNGALNSILVSILEVVVSWNRRPELREHQPAEYCAAREAEVGRGRHGDKV
jgi:hypothetical protein